MHSLDAAKRGVTSLYRATTAVLTFDSVKSSGLSCKKVEVDQSITVVDLDIIFELYNDH